MGTTRIRIKVGDVELDYEGEANFEEAETGLLKLVEKLQALSANLPRQLAAKPNPADGGKPAVQQLTTRNIAVKLDAKTGPDLARAAIAQLWFVQQNHKMKRGEIHDQMKTADGVYKPNMAGNLTKTINGLVADGIIIECETEVYALPPGSEETLRQSIGVV